MNLCPNLISNNMLSLGRATLAHTMDMAVYYNLSANYNQSYHRQSIAVLTAAHAAEIIIKARIAKEHPLLIFKEIPKKTKNPEILLDISQLMQSGKTLTFHELPDRLWATTGYELPELKTYQSFGKLRNTIQHFTRPETDLTEDIVKFIFDVLQPFLWEQWNLLAIEYFDDCDGHEYVIPFVSDFPVKVKIRESWSSYLDEVDINNRDKFIIVEDKYCSSNEYYEQ